MRRVPNFKSWSKSVISLVTCLLLMGAHLDVARAVTPPFFEPFNTDVATKAQFLANYSPPFTLTSNVLEPVTITGGVLNLTDETSVTVPGIVADIIIKGNVGAVLSNGNYNVGVSVGGSHFVFHPGFGGGAFRVDGQTGNQNMGYTPPNGVLHQVEIRQFPSGQFDIKITDGSNPLNVYTTTFNSLPSVGGAIGFRRSGGTPNAGIFDNLEINYAAVLTGTPPDGSTIDMGEINMNSANLRTDAFTLQNTGAANSSLDVQSYTITGPDAALFSIPDFAPITLTVGATDMVMFDLLLNANGSAAYNAQLVFMTSIGELTYDLTAVAVPEPSTLALLGLGAMGLAIKARRRRTVA